MCVLVYVLHYQLHIRKFSGTMLPYELLGKFIHVLESEGFPPINQSGEFFSKFCRNNGVSTPLPREILNLKDTFMRGIKVKYLSFVSTIFLE